MARPLKFTPEIGANICKLVRVGIPVGVAARVEGIAKSTLYEWKDRGEAGDPIFVDFAAQLEKALGECEVAITLNVIKLSKEDWRAGAFWLKCRNPEQYGDRLEITQQVQRNAEETFDAMRPHMSDAAYLEMLHAFAKVTGLEGVGDRATGRAEESSGSH